METWVQRYWPVIVWWLWMPLLYLVTWGGMRLLTPGMDWLQELDQFMYAHFWTFSWLSWIWLCVGFAVTAGYIGYCRRNWYPHASAASAVVAATSALLAVVCFVVSCVVNVDSDKDFARYYADSTVYYVEDLDNPPATLEKLTDTAVEGNDDCALIGSHDVPSCINQGNLSEAGWDARVGSLSGAIKALERASGDRSGVSLHTDTMAYLNASDGQPARWSGVLDGSGKEQPMAGVAEWTGEGRPTQCLFEDEYDLDRALRGTKMKNLPNLLADTYPDMRFDITDVWGYCAGGADGEPIVVIPMTRQVNWGSRTVDTAAGVVTVRGDNGNTSLEYYPSVEEGQGVSDDEVLEFPGPVYPASLVATQREQSIWSAGRKWMDNGTFGYEPTGSIAQAGNVSEYLLRDAETGRLVWVTPLTLNSSSSELFLAYAVTYADEVSNNQLNELSIYALPENDFRRINIDNLEAQALNFMANNAGTFRTNGGELVEFIPVDGNVWRAFGELNGLVVYRLDISADGSIAPRLVQLAEEGQPEDEEGGSTPPPTPESMPSPEDTPQNTSCGSPVDQLTQEQLLQCAQQFLDELARQQQGTTTD